MTDKMRIAIVSDTHGNIRAFQAVLADLRWIAPDLVVHGGDLAFGGARPAEIIDHVRSLGWLGVRGNTDEMLWAPEGLAEFAATAPKLAPLLAILQEMIPPTLASIGEERHRRRVAEYLRFSWRANRGLRTYSSSLHTPTSKDDRGEHRQRQSIL
jgi:3',5'-cyclic AMP phosphodiesterase CpdA